ncbi:MAG: hypothetical protein IKQ52_09585 [Bacteroidales bacterium]|nr:hypothetical protein [Bacteroidales bacterium]MBR6904719.1 hypothetical protein [Bacteroidales bacterium]
MKPRLFKAENNTKAEELKQFIPVSVNFNIKNLLPSLSAAETKYISPVIGESLFLRVETYYNATTRDNVVLDRLLELLQGAVAALAYSDDYYSLSVKLDDSGATSPKNRDQRLYRYQEDNLIYSLKQRGYETIDMALEHCENHLTDLPEYGQSPWYKESRRHIIRSTAEFNSIFNINNSRLVFMRMSRWCATAEELNLHHRISRELTDAIIAGRDSEKYAPIIEDIKKYLVYTAVADCVEELKVSPTERGMVYEEFFAYNDGKSVNQLKLEEAMRMKDKYHKLAENYLTRATDWLNEHASEFPEYERLRGRNNPRSGELRRDNNGHKIVMA